MRIKICKLLLIFLISCNFCVLAEIKKPIFSIKDATFQEVLDKLYNNALVVFDVDETLIMAKDKILRQHPREIVSDFVRVNFYDVLWDLYGWDLDQKGRLTSIRLKSMENDLVEPEIIGVIKKLRAKNIRIIALTDIYTGKYFTIESMLDWRFQQLYGLGIDLSIGNPKNMTFYNLPKGETGYPTFYKGILATSISCKKGPALVEFFKQLNLNPSYVVFLDDHESQIKSVNEELTRLNIPCSAFHYKATEIVENKIDFKVAELQFKHLIESETWLSDMQAKKLIEDKECEMQFTNKSREKEIFTESFEFNQENENKEEMEKKRRKIDNK